MIDDFSMDGRDLKDLRTIFSRMIVIFRKEHEDSLYFRGKKEGYDFGLTIDVLVVEASMSEVFESLGSISKYFREPLTIFSII